mgnify:FL=1
MNADRLVNGPDIKKLGIIAGGGQIPARLADCCEKKGIEVFVCAFEGQTDKALTQGRHHIWSSLGAAGKIIKTFKDHNVHDLVLIGSIRRPSLAELKPDIKTAEFFARIGLKALGDNDLLELLKDELGREGFTVHGVQSFMQDLLAPCGVLGKHKPPKALQDTIKRGVIVSQEIGRLDIGQSVLVQQGHVIAVEAAEGTDEMIRRAKAYMRKGGGGVLVKTCKPMQHKYLDLPTIGPDTIMVAVECGLSGVVIEAGSSLLLDPEIVRDIADRHKLFVIGIDTADYMSS